MCSDARRFDAAKFNLVYGPCSSAEAARQIIETAIGCYLQINRSSNVSSKQFDHTWISRVQFPNPAVAIIGEEIIAQKFGGELNNIRIIENATRDRAAQACTAAMHIREERRPESRISRWSFCNRPAII